MTPQWFQTFADGIAEGDPTYRRCEDCGSAWLPPREVCNDCGSSVLADTPLSCDARVVAATEIEITIPRFSGSAPYTVVIAEFDAGVRLTGQLRGTDGVERGDSVELGVETRGEHDRLVVFTPH